MLPSQRPRLLSSLALPSSPAAAASRAALAAAPAQESGPKGSRPNILFIFSDDHATARHRRLRRATRGRGPHAPIDKLAGEGMVFQRSFCTNSICGPSRAVILTGKHSHVNGFMANGNRFDGGQPTFPKMLKKAGYTTAMIGKWHLGSDPQGFDYWDVLPGQGAYYNPAIKRAEGRRVVEGHCTDIVTDLALEWLEGNKRQASSPGCSCASTRRPTATGCPPPGTWTCTPTWTSRARHALRRLTPTTRAPPPAPEMDRSRSTWTCSTTSSFTP